MAPLAPIVNRNNLLAGGIARRVAFSALALAVTPFIFTAPVYATDDNTVSIAVDQNATLQSTGTFYKATTNVTVKTGKPYGFNLTMQADTADLVNSKDSTHKISATPSSTPVALNANQWGYSLNKSATTFSAVPAGTQATPAVVADVTKAKPAGCTNPANCTKSVTFAANVDPAKLASGSYSTIITYTATAKPAPKPVDWPQRTAKIDPSEVCRSGDGSSSCLVDLDRNMIPVKYTGTTTNAQWTSVAKPEDEDAKGNWYDYGKKQWANAITVKDPSKYKGKNMVVEQSDILGYWVYIPRYRYQVLRFSPKDPVVSPPKDFTIEFENTNNHTNIHKATPWKNGDWATHPAFTFGKKEFNGIWFAKFETTSTTDQPTVLPNQAHISGYYSGINKQVGNFYSLSKTLGINDPNNVGGGGFTTTQNNHHLAKLSSHMVNNNDWGAATYLSASKYGAGFDKVQINANGAEHTNYGITRGTTGCGPQADNNTSEYYSSGTLGTPQACGDAAHAYNGSIGKYASTTNNVYGIYDMSGGGLEYVAASYSGDPNYSNAKNFGTKAQPPYVNNYSFGDTDSCTFATCGGQALYETYNGKKMYLAGPFTPWFLRGGDYSDGSFARLISRISYIDGGSGFGVNAFRVALVPALQD